MIENELKSREGHVLSVARAMMAAARTAPKAKGFDNLDIAVVTGKDLEVLAKQIKIRSEELGYKFFLRDADNVLASEAVVIIGTRLATVGLNCAMCGFKTCEAKPKNIPCAFNMSDLGIACGSAAALAADFRIDTRIMYSVGRVAMEMGMVKDCHAAFAILLSSTSKSPYFDRIVNK